MLVPLALGYAYAVLMIETFITSEGEGLNKQQYSMMLHEAKLTAGGRCHVDADDVKRF